MNFSRLFQKIMQPMFGIIALDAVTRSLQTTFANPTLALSIPRAGTSAITLTFNLLRLKMTAGFAKGLPFGMGSFANFATRLSALQIALAELPVFLDPANYAIRTTPLFPGQTTTATAPAGYVQLSTNGTLNIGDTVVISGSVDAGRTGVIESFDGRYYRVSGIANVFEAYQLTRTSMV